MQNLKAKLRKSHKYKGMQNINQLNYFILNWDEPILQKNIPKTEELIQILHCATIYSIHYWMILIEYLLILQIHPLTMTT